MESNTLIALMMNMFFSGRLQAMPAIYTTNDNRFQVIRPLIECAENQIAQYAVEAAFPILPCNLCGSQSGLQRDAMARLLTQLEGDIPNVREVMLAAIKNVRTTHLLDRRVAGLEIDDEEIQEDAETDPVTESPQLIQISG